MSQAESLPAPAGPLPVSPSMAGSVGYLLHRAFLQTQDILVARVGGERHPRDLTLLAHLRAAGPCSQQELATRMSVNRSVMVGVIDALERDGLVVRERNPADRRSYAVTATDRADELLERLTPTMLAGDAELTRRLSAAERREVMALLRTLLGPSLPVVVAPASKMVGYLVARAHWRLHVRADEALEALGIEVREFGALATLDDVAPCPQQLVATLTGVSGPVIVELMDALEPRGLVRRERNPLDRRSYALQLSEAGSELVGRARAVLASEIDDQIVEALGDPSAYDRLAALLRQMIGAADPPD